MRKIFLNGQSTPKGPKRNKIFTYLFIPVIVIFISIQSINFVVSRDRNERILTLTNENELYHINLLLNYRYANFRLGDAIMIKDTINGIKQVKNLFKKHFNLGLFYPNEICSSCFEKQFNDILATVDSLNLKENGFFILMKFENSRLLKVFQESNRLKCKILNIDISDVRNTPFFLKQPVLFVVDNDLNVKSFCIISYSDFKLAREFFNIYLENNNNE